MAFFAAGVGAALFLTPERCHLAQKWIWLGGLIALALALPNVIWQMQHHWATWELLHNVAQSNKNVVLTPAQFIAQQVLIMNPATLPLWLGGLIWLLASREGRRYRVIAIAYLVTLAEFILMHGKHYYLAPAYPMLFAAGAVAAERLFSVRLQWLKPALLVAMIALAALVAPTVVPILPPQKVIAYMKSIHFEPPPTETSHTAALPQLFADQFGWEEMVRRSLARLRESSGRRSEAARDFLPGLWPGRRNRFFRTEVRTSSGYFRTPELFSVGSARLQRQGLTRTR
jgi:hypothetical protein